ncbi:hypothetical protein [uncultured Psychroserpens sp.]|uniref:hypothetical protein n=1 Tax=uncultured Psychroserpens sp. TaxID=255436 RepID=UPI00262682ED|nr:hypothetical protein [uncultured Psychroserpens sp.]
MESKWEEIYNVVKTKNLTADGKSKLAIEFFLGKEWIEKTVDFVIELHNEFDLAVKCLQILESEHATDYAYNIYKESTRKDTSELAVFVIKEIAHPKSIKWVEEFLNQEHTAEFGLGLLDQLLWCEKIEPNEETERLLTIASEKLNGELIEQVDFIKDYLIQKSSS